MTKALRKFILLLLFLCPIFIYSDSKLSIQNIDNLGKITSLDSNNQYYWYAINKKISPSSLEDILRKPEIFLKNWKPYKAPDSIYNFYPEWENSEILSYVKFFRVPETIQTSHVSIRLGVITDKDVVFLNGKEIGSTGDFNYPRPEAYDKIRIYPIPSELLKKGEVNTLLIWNKPYFPYSAGIEQDRIEIGPTEDLEAIFYKEEFFKILLLMIYLTVAFYFLFLFIRRRKDFENLFFGLFTLNLVCYQFMRNQLKYEIGIEFFYLKKFEYLVLMPLVPLMYHFIRSYFKFSYALLFKILDSIIGIAFLFILFTDNIINYDFVNKNIVQPLWILYIGSSFYFLVNKSLKKDLDAILMFFGFIFLLVAAILDILSTRNVIVLPRMAGYAFITLILSIATILANKFVRLNQEVEELNANLEKKVIERTEALNQSLEEVRKLKVQQDGDYFLTSLLLNPLITNKNKSSKIKVEFFTKQKKTFEFKGKKHEIGGDISISTNIELQGKKYTVFINGDAMGKSIQGAGGALVLGVVFNAVLTRSNAEINKNKSPELWIKEAFIDLQRVFESFNGSMLISVVLGLIDEDSGLLYYINAEHPWTVLYRDEKASFLENELVLRKLGFPGNEESFFVKIFQLREGDVLIAGSDGRDDILLGVDEYGVRIINENEENFLKVVEEAKSNLESIVDILEKMGEFTDDITLVRVEYLSKSIDLNLNSSKEFYEKGKDLLLKGEYEEAITTLLESYEKEPHLKDSSANLLAQAYFRIKEWDNALKYFEISISSKPFAAETLFYASYAAKMCKKFEKAIEYGERCFIRDPKYIKNLVNLADVYKKMNMKEKALFLVERALKEEPMNENALRLKELLQNNSTILV